MNKSTLLQDIFSLRIIFVAKDKFRLSVMFFLMFSGAVLEAIGIGIIPAFVTFAMNPSSISKVEWLGSWVKFLPDSPSAGLLLSASLLFLAFMLLKNLYLAFVYYWQTAMVNDFRVRLSCRMFETYQKALYEWLMQRGTPELQRNIIRDVNQVVSGILMPLLDLAMAFFMTLFIVVALIYTTSPITMVAIAIIGAGAALTIVVFRVKLEAAGSVARVENKKMIQSIQQGFGALVDARLTASEAYLSGQFKEAVTREAAAQITKTSITRSTPLSIETVALAGLLALFVVLYQDDSRSSNLVAMMGAVGMAVIRLKQIVSRVTTQVQMLNQSRASIPELVSDIYELETIESIAITKQSAVSIQSDSVESFKILALENISYTYPNMAIPAIQGVSLTIKRGESVAFVGSTGSGKSTLLNILLGLLVPRSGVVRFNGLNIENCLGEWRKHLGYIPQSIFLTDDTIRANIAFGVLAKDVDSSRLESALNSAQLLDFVSALPDGLDTMVGEQGTRLSGGQRQRIGIARALYFEPEVLVLDEATSALDNETEMEVVSAIQNLKKDRTCITVAHRLSTVEDCDRLYFLEAGEVVAEGTFNELLEGSVKFRSLALRSAGA
jgi:ABC-type multidrug transport system fused ATPase/permease subunit